MTQPNSISIAPTTTIRLLLILLLRFVALLSSFGVVDVTSLSSSSSSSRPSSSLWNEKPPEIRYRGGTRGDELVIAARMARELMNPLGIEGRRFVVAINEYGERIGWVQLRPLGPSAPDPNVFDAAPGSAYSSLESDVDDEIWQEFEEQDVEFPSGFASLPWTKEYRAISEAAKARREKRAALIEARQREAAKEEGLCWELASLWVSPSFRGRGIGSELVRRMLGRHTLRDHSSSDIYLLTLGKTADWYRRFGFEITNVPPAQMEFEIAAGSIVTRFLSEELICMKGGNIQQ